MKKIYILPLLAAGMIATGCSKEDPFSGGSENEGQVLKSALAVDIKADEIERHQAPTRAESNLDDFNVVFYKDGQAAPAAKYRYGDMPDVVTLPAGTYTCTATYGENRDAAWDSPCYLGTSEQFEVSPYEITSYISPIECTLENVMVSISFDAALEAAMSADSYVEVKVGDKTGLNFTKTEADAGKPGYFKHTEETTLVATFNGKINGTQTVETKSYRNVEKGHHYHITFKIHNHDGDASGDSEADVAVDATVTVTDVERNVDIAEDDVLDDSERPKEDDPTKPDDPDEPKVPAIVAQAPINIDAVNNVSGSSTVVLNITSYADGGVTGFTCDIQSPTLTAEELQQVGLDSHLDLVTPGSLEGALSGLGFPVNVGGRKSIEFNLTNFMPMLAALGAGEHHFVLKVTDANGTTEKTLILNVQ